MMLWGHLALISVVSLSAITYFCLEKESPPKAATEPVLIQPSLEASYCRHSEVLTPVLIFCCCLILGISSATSAGLGFFHWFHPSAVNVDAAWASVLLMIFDLLGCRLGKI